MYTYNKFDITRSYLQDGEGEFIENVLRYGVDNPASEFDSSVFSALKSAPTQFDINSPRTPDISN